MEETANVGPEAPRLASPGRRKGFALGAALVVVLGLGAGAALAGRTVTVGSSSNGKSLELERGDTLVVRLAGNVSTGYRWDLVSLPPSLRKIGSSYEQRKAGPPMPGQGGIFVFRFAVRAGEGTLRLAYHRPWQKAAPPLRRFTLAVTGS
ncbi:MAG: protease inhibitor I42 family protein [Gaiellaceae bacterium]